MKRSKKLFSLLIVLVILCVGTVLLTQIEERQEQIKSSGEIILEISPDDVQSLKWEYGETSLAFHKDDVWLYDADEAFPVNEEKIHEMLEQFQSFGVAFIIEDVSDYGVYGLNDPVCTIEISTAEQDYTIKLGDYSKMDEERYVSIGDGNVYLAKIDPLEEFDAVLDDTIRHDQSLSYRQIQKIQFNGAENYTITYEDGSSHALCEDDVYFTDQSGEVLPLDTGRVETWLESLTTLHLSDYVTYNATEEDLKTCQLLDPELTITVDYTTVGEDGDELSNTFVLSISRDPEELAAAEAAEANEEEPEEVSAYVRVGDSQIIYRVSEYNSNHLRAVSYNELRHRQVLIAEFEDVTQLDATLDGKRYTLLSDGESDDDARLWKYNDEEVDLQDLQSRLESLCVEYSSDFTSDAPTGKKEISLTVHLDHAARPTVQIDLYRHDGASCLAVVDGESLALVPRSDVVALMEAVNSIVLDEAS